MKTKFIYLLTVSIVLSLISCGDGKKKETDSTTNPIEFNKILVDAYEISIPRDMRETTGLNSDASLQYQNIHKEIYTIVIDEPMKVFEDALEEMGYQEESSISLYRDIQLKQLRERMEVTHQSEPKPIIISGLEAETIELTAKVDNIEEELSYSLTFIDGKVKIYLIMSWTLKSMEQEHKKTFEAIAKSFKIRY